MIKQYYYDPIKERELFLLVKEFYKSKAVKATESIPILPPEKSNKDWRVRTAGVKHDKGKFQPVEGLLSCFPRALEDISRVSEFGANKYSWGGWRTVPDGLNRYKEAQLRHMLEVAKGKKLDQESKMLHLAHSAWNALAVLELYIAEEEDKTKEIDLGEKSSKDVGQESPRDALRATENTHNNKYSFWGIVGR